MKKLISLILVITFLSTAILAPAAEARSTGSNTQAAGAISDEISSSLMNSVASSMMGESMSMLLALGEGDGSGGSSTPVMTNGYTKLDLNQLLDNCENKQDTDGDSLPDELERLFGTEPEKPDTDEDGLKDFYELKNGLDPLNQDTNGDGIPDYTEIMLSGKVEAGKSEENYLNPAKDTDGDGVPDFLDRDNDGDGVPDNLDISPFSYGELQDFYEITIETSGNPRYVDFQIQPKDLDDLYKKMQTYDWPYDEEGNIQDSEYSRKDMTVNPMAEISADNPDHLPLPSDEDCIKYGMVKNDGKLYVPLAPVEDQGKKVALAGKVYIEAGTYTKLKIRLFWSMDFNNDRGTFQWNKQS
ncbi:MAG TPA: hypothetical protein DD727_02305, partial [Clostridiales bacterium]|nr:hypothetical protein [Clostridiales bacterium]